VLYYKGRKEKANASTTPRHDGRSHYRRRDLLVRPYFSCLSMGNLLGDNKMNDELLNIKLTESEVNMIMDALNGAIMPTPESQDLMHDLLEQVARHDDPDWNIDTDPTDLEGQTFTISEDDFIDAGIRAREQAKATSMAASRRTMRFTRSDTDETTSEIKNHDLWDRPNDPIKW
tara:strand:+ start:19786 stop:20307 length:522 start_codon:yes stop_codon:yes gene_type:complete